MIVNVVELLSKLSTISKDCQHAPKLLNFQNGGQILFRQNSGQMSQMSQVSLYVKSKSKQRSQGEMASWQRPMPGGEQRHQPVGAHHVRRRHCHWTSGFKIITIISIVTLNLSIINPLELVMFDDHRFSLLSLV